MNKHSLSKSSTNTSPV